MLISSPLFAGGKYAPKPAPKYSRDPFEKLGQILKEERQQKAKAADIRANRLPAPNAAEVLSAVFLAHKGVRITGADVLERIVELNDMYRGKTNPPTVADIGKELHLERFPEQFANVLKTLEQAGLIKIESIYTPDQVYLAVSNGFREEPKRFYIDTTEQAKQVLLKYKGVK